MVAWSGWCRGAERKDRKVAMRDSSQAKEMFNITFGEVIIGMYVTVKPIRLKTENLHSPVLNKTLIKTHTEWAKKE